jgi:hypothetical protein
MLAGHASVRKVAVLALGLGALGLGATGCGNSAAKKQAAVAQAQADAQWRTGLAAWHKSMLGALNGMSILFSSAGPVQLLQASDRKVGARLAGYDETLAGCSAMVEALGPAPADLVEARKTALRACKNLEQGAKLVEAGVKQLQHGLGVTLFDDATTPLSAGQDGMVVAASEARRVAPP